jgi:hypothetical protein
MRLQQSRTFRGMATWLICVGLIAGGCSKTRTEKVARYQPGGDEIMRTVPRTGIYKVVWKRGSKDKLYTIDGTETLLNQGEQAGFEPLDDGTVVAVAGHRRIVIDQVPENPKYLAWYHKSTQQTEFGRDVEEVMQASGSVAMYTAVVGGIIVLSAIECEPSMHKRHRHKH